MLSNIVLLLLSMAVFELQEILTAQVSMTPDHLTKRLRLRLHFLIKPSVEMGLFVRDIDLVAARVVNLFTVVPAKLDGAVVDLEVVNRSFWIRLS